MQKFLSMVAVAAFALCLNIISAYSASEDVKTVLSAEVNESKASAANYVSRASSKFMKKDINGAISDMDKAIKLEPANPLNYLNRGYLKHVSQDLEGAMNDYESALKINPNYAYAYNNRGVLKVAMNDTKGAMEDYNKALSINPKYSDVYYNRGNLKYMLSDNNGALSDFDKAIELNPKDSDAYNNRGVVKKRLNFNVGALSDYSQAIALNPKDSIAYTNRGKLKKMYFDNEGAAIDLNQAVALAETQTFIKNVKPLLSNDRYIAALPVVNGITPDNPVMIKVKPNENEKLVESKPTQSDMKALAQLTSVKKVKTKPATATPNSSAKNKKPAVDKKQDNIASSSVTLNAGIGTVKAIEPPDIRTSTVENAPTTNVKLAESYYIRGLQKCVLRDLKGAVSDLDKALANNSKYADAYFYRAAIRKELGDIEGFKKDYTQAIQLNPKLQTFNDANAIGLVQG